tara:strand:- start:6453 stop:6653 length:201 start_codon:yes stop_codon:yes gene_type:complete
MLNFLRRLKPVFLIAANTRRKDSSKHYKALKRRRETRIKNKTTQIKGENHEKRNIQIDEEKWSCFN